MTVTGKTTVSARILFEVADPTIRNQNSRQKRENNSARQEGVWPVETGQRGGAYESIYMQRLHVHVITPGFTFAEPRCV